MVSRYSTVRSGTLTWREWGLWSSSIPHKATQKLGQPKCGVDVFPSARADLKLDITFHNNNKSSHTYTKFSLNVQEIFVEF